MKIIKQERSRLARFVRRNSLVRIYRIGKRQGLRRSITLTDLMLEGLLAQNDGGRVYAGAIEAVSGLRRSFVSAIRWTR